MPKIVWRSRNEYTNEGLQLNQVQGLSLLLKRINRIMYTSGISKDVLIIFLVVNRLTRVNHSKIDGVKCVSVLLKESMQPNQHVRCRH